MAAGKKVQQSRFTEVIEILFVVKGLSINYVKYKKEHGAGVSPS